jgi:hypothetical protein
LAILRARDVPAAALPTPDAELPITLDTESERPLERQVA